MKFNIINIISGIVGRNVISPTLLTVSSNESLLYTINRISRKDFTILCWWYPQVKIYIMCDVCVPLEYMFQHNLDVGVHQTRHFNNNDHPCHQNAILLTMMTLLSVLYLEILDIFEVKPTLLREVKTFNLNLHVVGRL